MDKYIIAYDLGTGGCKASLYSENGDCLSDSFVAYETHSPKHGWHEQKPQDWWEAVVQSTKSIVSSSGVPYEKISAIGISGHSLGSVPINHKKGLLLEKVPIWSDSRPTEKELNLFFNSIDEEEWYSITGNGFPPALYTVFKLMWLKNNNPVTFNEIDTVLGTKDYINYKMTGVLATDYSYASGSGVFDLERWKYSEHLIKASGLPASIFPELKKSTDILGTLKKEIAEELGLHEKVKVVAGGVDNSCMALGAQCFKEGRIYNSLGSSSWIAVCSSKPIINTKSRPYVFAHVVPGMYVSATAIFSAGTSFKWLRNNMCQYLKEEDGNIWEQMTALAELAPVGSNKLLFNPSLAGGTLIDKSPNVRGAFVGIDLRHTSNDIIRSVMEGITMGLRCALDELRSLTSVDDEIKVVGGGSKSELWRQIYANVYNATIVKTSVDEQVAALGAAALAAVGTGLWPDFSRIDEIHKVESVKHPHEKENAIYEKLLPVYKTIVSHLSDIGDMLQELDNS